MAINPPTPNRLVEPYSNRSILGADLTVISRLGGQPFIQEDAAHDSAGAADPMRRECILNYRIGSGRRGSMSPPPPDGRGNAQSGG